VVKNENDLSPLFLHYIFLSLESFIEKTLPRGNYQESKKYIFICEVNHRCATPHRSRWFARVSFRDGKQGIPPPLKLPDFFVHDNFSESRSCARDSGDQISDGFDALHLFFEEALEEVGHVAV